MLNGAFGNGKSNTLLNDYASLLGDAVLRERARHAESSARIEADLANRVKSEFISIMSHELRTPLNTVIGFSKILTEQKTRKLSDNEVEEYAVLIQKAATQLLSVLNDILDMSKIQSGKYTLDAREVSLNDVVGRCVSETQKAAEEAGLSLTCKLPETLPAVRGDADKLRQVFTHLLNNSVKFTPAGGSVAVEAVRLADDSVAIRVRDTGVGMSEKEIELAMMPFGQVDSSRSRWKEGTGLGLPIAKSLIGLHGGRLEIKSEKDKGTQIITYLPSRHTVSVADSRQALLGEKIAY